jgi:plasmid stabilization system protein ParE
VIATSLRWSRGASDWRKSRNFVDPTSKTHRIGARWVGKHTIFYRVDVDASLLIVRILHGSMLPELHLPGALDDEDGEYQ